MRNEILNKDSISLPGGTKTKHPGGNVWISKPGRISGSRNSLVRKDKVMHGHTKEVLWHRGIREAVKPLLLHWKKPMSVLLGNGMGSSLSTKRGLTKSQGKFNSKEM